MPNPVAAVSAQQTPPPPLPPPSRPLGDQDRDNSADESWSAADSDNDRINQNGTRALKRKRPLTVSYVLGRTFVAPSLTEVTVLHPSSTPVSWNTRTLSYMVLVSLY